ncbi:sigma-70 family RNA polymerase sigma factor [Rubripirellula amarantea]|uniref:ECF RNA polymerase sigma-E factor n=1 Tax=Rubripirellula amarantea TaxID=2527999 RepID=A0A5C5WFT5_9BACT|nr:sigma-70 family RNA polymerase sigma factor [Rubripirellula amarantea]MDA8743892.1 sigma-70 family RNA polymerase sigma factor [Rubripirellula amarantea]TWT49618.1 ECF RNA polymerase sigma-E factor [Rubripirellula amarantea]
MTDCGDPEERLDLFRRAISGDTESLDRLLASFSGYLHVLSRTHLDKRIQHRVSPSDVVQETLMEAHRDIANFHGLELHEFTGWLRQVLVHNIANAVGTHMLAAKRSVHREQLVGSLSASVDHSHQRLSALAADAYRSPASEAGHQETLSELAAALEQLPSDYRTVIVLRHLEGLDFAEVADRMERTSGAVRMLWLRAIEHLRLAMEKQS